MQRQQRVAAIHDISGFGRCSLTEALPIISCAGIETSVIPTAVLSTHTGGFEGYTYRDLTEDLRAFSSHWKTLGIEFDAIYTGYLGSFDQIAIISDIFEELKTEQTIIVVDPVMADNGKLYSMYTPEMAIGMKKLCQKADIITPNMTEAAFLLGEEYKAGPYTKEYIEYLLKGLSEMGAKDIIITGVYFEDERLGAACFDSKTGKVTYAMAGKKEGIYHGTGDIFTSVLVSAVLRGMSLTESAQLSADFVIKSINATPKDTKPCYGVCFEKELGWLINALNERGEHIHD